MVEVEVLGWVGGVVGVVGRSLVGVVGHCARGTRCWRQGVVERFSVSVASYICWRAGGERREQGEKLVVSSSECVS